MGFDTFFTYPREAFEKGTFLFANVLDPFWWIAAAIAVVVLLVASAIFGRRLANLAAWKRVVIVALQSAVALGVIALLAGPTLQTSTLQPGANSVAVLMDTSGSMGFTDALDGDRTRIEAANRVLREAVAPTLADLADTAFFTFAESAERGPALPESAPATSSADNRGTNVVAALANVLESFKGAPLAAVVLLSDGADNSGEIQADLAALTAAGVPIHTIGFGPLALPGEVQLADVQLAADAPPASQVSANLVIEHSGSGEAIVRVRDSGELLAAQRVTLPADSPVVRTQIAFDSGDSGIRELEFEIEPGSADVVSRNNRIERLLTVSERQRRFLYLEGEPRWEYKFIRRAVAGDEVLDFVSWVRTTDRKTYRQGVSSADELEQGFPETLPALYGYDVIVLGSYAASNLNDQQHAWLESFVAERGGSLLALAGRAALSHGGWDVQPLADALPVVLDRATDAEYEAIEGSVRPTREGLASPLTQLTGGEGLDAWATLPPLGDLQRLGKLKPAATTLLELVTETDTQPLLVTQPYGLGTTAVLATATTWRWQMRTPPEDPRHQLFWRQLLRQLAETAQRPRSVNLHLDGDDIVIRASLRDENFAPANNVQASATVIQPDRTETAVSLDETRVPGVFSGKYVFGTPGVHRVDVTLEDAGGRETLTRFVQTGTQNAEYFRPVRDEALLKRIATSTGGRYWDRDALAGLATALTFTASGIRTVELLPLWQMPVLFLILVLLKLGEWGLRRLWGRI